MQLSAVLRSLIQRLMVGDVGQPGRADTAMLVVVPS